MGSSRREQFLKVLLAATTALAFVAAAASANAQGTGAVSYDIPAQSLTSALTEVAQRGGLRLAYSASLSAGRSVAGLHGTYTAAQAIGQLLAGSGLTYRFTSENAVTIEPQEAEAGTSAVVPGAVPLDTINVEGDQQSPYGPGVGYTATRSVTGTKSDTPIIETPQSISVVTRAQIDAQNAQTVDQALRYTAGVEAESRADFTGFDFVYGRGFTLDEYLNGLKLQGANAYISPSIDVYNIGRINILRGPASILYGQASPGGLIDIDNKMPTETPYHEIMLQGGSYGNFVGAFDLSGPIDKDGHFLYRLTGVGKDSDNQVDFVKSRRVSISPDLTWKPDGDTSLTILTNFQRDPSVGLYNFVPATGTIYSNPNGKIPTSFYAGDPNYNRIDRTQYSIGYMFEHHFNDIWTFRQNFRFMHVDGNLDQVLPIDMLDDETMERYALLVHDNVDAITLDNQAQAKFDTGPFRHTLLGGVDFQRTYFNELVGQGLAPDLNVFAPVYYQPIAAPQLIQNENQISNQVGVYGQDQIRVDHWALLIGGREDWASEDTSDSIAETSSKQFDHQFSYRGGIVYLFDNGVAPYVSYTTSFQPEIGTQADGTSFKPTTAQQVEGGVKYQLPGSNSYVMASIYQLTQQNVPTTDPNNPAFNIQTGEIRTRGAELEAHLNLLPGFNVLASYGYANAIVTESTTDDLGKVPLYIPRNLASLWADYTIQHGPFTGLRFGGGARFVDATFGDPENALKVPSYTLFDAALSYDLAYVRPELRGWSASLNATNLFDKVYVSECSNESYCLYGLRRTVLLNVRYRW